MSKTVLAQVDGFTPIIDALVEDVGIVAAAVFGRMWRYCQMENGVCHASLSTIADELHISIRTVMRHSDNLVSKGYLKDTTPDLRNIPHTYADTGKAGLRISVTGMTKSHSGYDKLSQRGMTKSHLKIVSKTEEETSGNKLPTKQTAKKAEHDPLLDHPAIIAYRDHAHLTPNNDQRTEIARVIGDDSEKWGALVRDWMLAGYKPSNVAGMLDAFKNGGLNRKYQQADALIDFGSKSQRRS